MSLDEFFADTDEDATKVPMVSIGIRAEGGSKIHYAIVTDADNFEINEISFLTAPDVYALPQQLKHIRYQLIDIIELYEVQCAVLRTQENPAAVTVAVRDRMYFEGMIQEALASSNIVKFKAGRKQSVANLLTISTEDFENFKTGRAVFENFPSAEDWRALNESERESVLVAFAGFAL